MDARKNFAFGTLASGINSAATSLDVGAGEGARFPAVSFNAVIWNKTDYASPAHAYHAGAAEIVRVTNIATDTFTITRAQESTSAVNLNTGGKTYEIWAGPTALYWTQAYTPGEVLTTRGDLVRMGASTPERVALGSLGTGLYSDGTDAAWYQPENMVVLYDEFIAPSVSGSIGETGWITFTSSGTVAVGTGETGAPGVFVISTSTSAAGLSMIYKNLAPILFSGGEYRYRARIKLSALSDGTETYTARIGFMDGTTAETDGAWIEYTHSANSGQWIGKTSNNSVVTTVNSAIAASTSWTMLEVRVNAAGTSVEFFVDNVSFGTSSTNIPTTTGRECGPQVKIIKSAGTTARTISIDHTRLTIKPTTAR